VVNEDLLTGLLKDQKDVVSFHKIQIVHLGDEDSVSVHLLVDKDMSVGDSHELCHRLESKLRKEYGSCVLNAHLEPCGHECRACGFTCSARTGPRK
jgi:divalent metal cation (Fe/Co/Zn/Cd) transporter